MMEGDASGRIFSFPIPTYNITVGFDWESPRFQPIWEMTAKYGIPYFSNFINSDMEPRGRPLHVLPAAPRQPRAAPPRRRTVRLQSPDRLHRRGDPQSAARRLSRPKTRRRFSPASAN
jgi:hypothetical protein